MFCFKSSMPVFIFAEIGCHSKPFRCSSHVGCFFVQRSILFATNRVFPGSHCFKRVWSSSFKSFEASKRSKVRSASCQTFLERSMPSLSTGSSDSRIPAVTVLHYSKGVKNFFEHCSNFPNASLLKKKPGNGTGCLSVNRNALMNSFNSMTWKTNGLNFMHWNSVRKNSRSWKILNHS